ncbi:MAG: PQQ-dependent sugar dehydrogenase [Gammaproteobacteria bacterium]|nr:PQQ-dependent sugar dehydrogenase [Gammaproteobacteria bacterium]MDE0247336.1 PQQ-dependent sugar dehydrogenase [Gammaproteobacteria bacterium]
MSRARSRPLGLAFSLQLLAATAAVQPGMAQPVRSREADFRVVTVAEGLDTPWSMAWLPNGDMLVTERPGRLRVVRSGVLDPDPVPGVPPVHARGQGGLLDVVLHPSFESNRLIYLSYSRAGAEPDQSTTAVARGRFDGRSLTDVEEIFEAEAWGERNGHYGSRLAFDAAGYLFITVGDRQAPSSGDLEAHPSQDLAVHRGTVVRLHDDGSVPADNPFAGHPQALPEIWSYGHRSPQGLAIDPETGAIWQGEHGPQGGDEVNLVLRGRNYGWPVVGYGVNYGPGIPIHGTQQRDGMEQPHYFWVPSIATSGLMVYRGDAFPGWKGDIFVGGLAGEQLARLDMDGETVIGEETIVRGSRVRDVREGPDGYIYLATENRDDVSPILRLEPAM